MNGKTEYWGNSYGYDAWGNLTQKVITKCGAESLSLTALANNQLSGYGYDVAGNMTSDPTDSVNASYDPENRIVSATKAGVTTSYVYDADGNRVEKTGAGTNTLYWYMTPGIVAESDLSGNLKSEYVFFNGERVARRDFSGGTTSVFYYFSDHLKTASVITDSAGNIKSESDYYPWGGELQFVANDSNHYKFTGKERDTESGLDYFGARYFSNGLGRLFQADEPFADQDVADPQSWNIYAYVRNNPLRYSDPSGGNCVGSFEGGYHDDGKSGGESCEDINDKDGEQGERTHADITVQASYTQEERIQLLSDDVSDYTSVSSLSEYGREGVKGAMTAEGLWNLPGDTLNLYRGFRMGVRMAGVRAAGELGEALVQEITGYAKNTEQIPSTTGAAYRVPDVLSHAKRIVGEVKNTRSKIYFTGQIKDEIAFAQSRGYIFQPVCQSGRNIFTTIAKCY